MPAARPIIRPRWDEGVGMGMGDCVAGGEGVLVIIIVVLPPLVADVVVEVIMPVADELPDPELLLL